jgi:hypothetical protein
MKLNLFVALIALCFFTSCQKELVGPDGATTITNPSTATSNLGTCKDCIYIPTCDGSVYNYSDTSGAIPGTPPTITPNSFTYRFIADTTIGGVVYQKLKLEGQTTNQFTYFNCSAGVTKTINYSATTTGGSVYSEIKLTILKANEAVGATWTDQIVQSPTQTAIYDYTIVAKGISRTVSGIVYPDVIQVNTVTSASVGGMVIPAGNSSYYFAKGVGLIEAANYVDFLGTPMQVLHRVLVSAQIP